MHPVTQSVPIGGAGIGVKVKVGAGVEVSGAGVEVGSPGGTVSVGIAVGGSVAVITNTVVGNGVGREVN